MTPPNSPKCCNSCATGSLTIPINLDPSLTHFIGSHGYNIKQLSNDLDRFVFLLGGNDGEPLFQPDRQ